MHRGVAGGGVLVAALVASSVACQLIAGLDQPLGSGSAGSAPDAADAAEELTCSPSAACGSPGSGCCITHEDGSAWAATCVTEGCNQPHTNLYFCYSIGDCPDGQSCCAHTLYAPPMPPNLMFGSVCSAGSTCPAEFSTRLCDAFHPGACGDAGCITQGFPPSGYPTYSYCE
jgi:hypothetical protein